MLLNRSRCMNRVCATEWGNEGVLQGASPPLRQSGPLSSSDFLPHSPERLLIAIGHRVRDL